MLRRAVRGQAIQHLLGHVLEQVVRDLPQGLRRLVRGYRVCPLAMWVDVFLQLVQRFRNQGRDRLACLLGERDQQAFLFRREVKRVCFHSLTIPKAPRICKKSSRGGWEKSRATKGQKRRLR